MAGRQGRRSSRGHAGGWRERRGRTEGLGGASSANCTGTQGAAWSEQLPMHWHNNAGGGWSRGGKGTRARGTSVPGTVGEHAGRTLRCHRGSVPLRGSCSQAGGPLQRAQPLAARAVGGSSEHSGQRRPRGGGVINGAGGAGRLTCRCRGRLGASLRVILAGASEPAEATSQTGWCGKRRSILATVPAASTPLARSAPPARCPEPISGTIYRIPLLRSPITTPEPDPYLYFPCVRLHRTMPCHGTSRVCVLECPPLGRPSLIKLVLVKIYNLLHLYCPAISCTATQPPNGDTKV